jgi:hypothetical protein
MTQLNYTFESLTKNIIAICQYLTTPHDSKNTHKSDTTDVEAEHEGNSKSFNLLNRLRECMRWIENNTNEVQEQVLVKSAHDRILLQICGRFSFMWDFGLAPSWNTEKLNLVRDFEVEMQTVIDKPPQNDTALRRTGMVLLRELENLRKTFHTEESTYDPPEVVQHKTETNSALSSLLAQLTNGA